MSSGYLMRCQRFLLELMCADQRTNVGNLTTDGFALFQLFVIEFAARRFILFESN